MYHQKCLLLKFISIIFLINCCLCEEDNNLETLDCDCEVEIDVVQNVLQNMLQKLRKLEKRMEKIEAHNEAKQLENLKPTKRVPLNCHEATAGYLKNGIYNIQISQFNNSTPFKVWCDAVTDFGGWTVFQRRVSDEEDFYRGWNDYKNGFGNLSSNFWLGLDKLHALTASCEHELYIKFQRFNGKKYYAKYNLFVVGSEAEDYVLLSVGKYEGTAGDSFKWHEGDKFSTHDRDNDEFEKVNCAALYHGAWWYKKAYKSNLNGSYKLRGIKWHGINLVEGMKFTEMMIRPTDNCKKILASRY